ncbi:MAG: hypothetical protein KIS77_17030 [Saprospiraceae bacterium]|nr:hypothetical protein [Saprospiraceae bacterium]
MRFLQLFTLFLSVSPSLQAQTQWPREIPLPNGGKVVIYEPSPESYNGNKISARAAVQIRKTAKDEPVFGAVWVDAIAHTNRDTRMLDLETIKVTNTRFPDGENESQIQELKTLLEKEVPKWNLEISLDRLLAQLESINLNRSDNLNTSPPKIIYKTKPTTLVLIDGEPIIQKDENMKMERVINSPFLILKDGRDYYLYAAGFWYKSANLMSGWANITKLPKQINEMDKQIKKQEKEEMKDEQPKNVTKTPTDILVSTEQAELIQTQGEPQFNAVEGTSLLYISNTENHIFKDINSQQNYVVLSGRWYSGPSLDGPWTYVPADKLPADFSKIPEGSEKDVVLANVAGTQAAKEAVMDAQIPQTAKVDRRTASLDVQYDGQPEFQPIEGTSLYLAENASITVMRAGNKYYAVDNGIWYVSNNATGPWAVSDERPSEVENIPAKNAAYNTKYVHIYDHTPDYVYVGYTPGYTGCYVYGPTIVYGTGYYYRPWWRSHYYPRPWTWGWNIYYNPWYGWSFGWGYHWHFGWSHVAWGPTWPGWYAWGGGWFGPPMYRPPYRPWGWNGGYYGPRPGGNRPGHYGPRPGGTNVGRPRPNNNIYHQRPGVITKEPRPGYRPNQPNTRPGTRPSTPSNGRQPTPRPSQPEGRPSRPTDGRQPSTRPSQPENQPRPSTRPSREPNNVITDKKGDIYQRDPSGNWNQRQNKTWKPAPSQSREQLNKAQQQRDRGATRQSNFNRGQQTKTAPRPAPAPSNQQRGRGN